jgi:3-dehydro-L-gulonate 2-dehydrogenase
VKDLLIPYETLKSSLEAILHRYGFERERAVRCAQLFAQADLDGVRSHGVNRFLLFLEYVDRGFVKPNLGPVLLSKSGMFERYDGQLGPGNWNAFFAMDRAIVLASEFGMGCVSLQNTNHWMRGGNFGWQAVEAGMIAICFTNTKANMPAWGGSEPKLGNNPLIMAVPRAKGPVVLDMAMSQFAYGKMSMALEDGEEMPFDAGFDQQGNLTRDPKIILEHQMALPIGLWKGTGLSLMLDLFASVLSGGKSTHEVEQEGAEKGLSQVFICFDPKKLNLLDWMEAKAEEVISDLKKSTVFEGKKVRYPGENTLETRKRNLERGVLVAEKVWNQLLKKLEK